MCLRLKVIIYSLLITFFATNFAAASNFVICDHGCFSKTHQEEHSKGDYFDLTHHLTNNCKHESSNSEEDDCQDCSLHCCIGEFRENKTLKTIVSFTYDVVSDYRYFIKETSLHLTSFSENLKNIRVPSCITSLRTIVLLS